MKLIACCVLLLMTVEQLNCKSTYSVNKTSTSWGYDYTYSDTRGFKVKKDDKEYRLEPFYNNTSTGLKKQYHARSVYDHFTSPGTTNDSQSDSSTNDIVNDTTSFRPASQGNNVRNKVISITSSDGEPNTEYHRVPVRTTHTVGVTETRPNAPDTKAHTPPSTSHGTAFGNMDGSPGVLSTRSNYIKTFAAQYGSQYSTMYGVPTGPLYSPQVPSYRQIYGPAGDYMYGIPNGQMYVPQTGSIYWPPMNGQMYEPQNGQMYRPQNGQMYVPENGQTYGYVTGPMYGSFRNY